MGFDLTQIASDDTHYQPFICNLCGGLCSLDALVTSECSHPFCRACLESHIITSNTCPTCPQTITISDIHSTSYYTMLHSQAVAAIPLQEAQPLAYQVLSMVQVACTEVTIPREEKALKSDCEWIGDYAHFTLHALEKHGVVATDGEASQPFLDTPVQSTNHSTTHFLNEVEEVQLKPCKGVSSSSAFILHFVILHLQWYIDPYLVTICLHHGHQQHRRHLCLHRRPPPSTALLAAPSPRREVQVQET